MSPQATSQARRRFLKGAIAVAGLALIAVGAAASVPSWRAKGLVFVRRVLDARRGVQAKLLAHFGYLRIPEEVAVRYVADYSLHVQQLDRFSLLSEDFYLRFLMSTDFFQNGGDEGRELAYVSLYGPSITPCYNPLVRPE